MKRLVWQVTALVAIVAAGILSAVIAGRRASAPPPECLDRVIQIGRSWEVECPHREHVLQRGREDGSLWLCICDAKGSEARRAKP